jgi:SAM-dependent methyltransferase
MTNVFFRVASPLNARIKTALQSYRRLMPYAPILAGAPAFVPYSAGGGRALAEMTLRAVDQTFPRLAGFLEATGRPLLAPIPASEFDASERGRLAAAELKVLFDRYGSDKARSHDYHLVYGPILADPAAVQAVLEVGLGTKHRDVVSHMGLRGRSGASHRAFRDFLPNARIFGADVDRRVLFEDERIQTSWVDQTNPESVAALERAVPDDLDLIIDDGLHTPNANIAILTLAMRKLRPGGWVVIEDIAAPAVPVWQVIASMMPADYVVNLVDAAGSFLFIARKM